MMKNRPLFYQVAALFLLGLELCSGQATYYMDAYRYGKTINLKYDAYTSNSFDSTIILKASSLSYPVPGQYAITVTIPQGILDTYRVWGAVDESFEIRNRDRFKIISTNAYSNRTIYDSNIGYAPKWFYADSGNKALIFELKLEGSGRLEGFDITLTAARYCFSSYSSKYYEFYCSNSYCIKDDLRCNGRDNCGNNYDETTSYCRKSSIIGFSIGGFLLAIALVIGGVILCRRRRNNRPTTLTTSTVIVPSQGNIYPGYQVPVANPVPPGTYLYATPPPPSYPGLNTTYPQNQPGANLPYPPNQQR